MRSTHTLIAALSLFTCLCVSAEKGCDKPVLYSNEQQIEFQANSGETTDAITGHLWVPENRNNPNSNKIRINYVRFPATGSNKGSPIVYLSGGPGGSGIATAKWRRFPLFQALREFGDVIALDQRGTGQSEQATPCVSSERIALNSVTTEAQIADRYRKAALQCFTQWKSQDIDIYGYNTEQNALDINDLRKHLKADKVSLWGISYGSHLALSAIKAMPAHLDKVIIASAEGLNQTVKLPHQTDQYFERVQGIINQQALKQQVSDLPALMRRVHSKLEQQPIALQITQKDGSKTPMLFQKHHIQSLASMMIADPNQYLAMLIHVYLGLDNGNIELLKHVLQRGMFTDEPITFKLMPLAMDVASGITAKRLAKVTTQSPTALLGDKLNFPMPTLHLIDKKLDLSDDFRAAPLSNIPTLVFTGSLDGRTYPEEQLEAVRGLTNLTQIMVNNAGHNLYTSSPLVLARMQTFLSGKPVSAEAIQLPLPKLALSAP
ncbi:alpha/beta hydrolase [Pseudoalteromonas sp. HM-SA03]|uniref:alpha/beta hydrolase n=1 Tax=Pseudoalteromonas sp. HM-SA03 TaxID=2029678 RepID=UPI000BADF5D5|nr:alpha/beta hydrolase [Pseudoalteromonas sp. HM-SA03]PAY02342.1 alpha/beta hydrolase [Pseudoalteromonas sp. HM-SA03]